MRRNHKTVFIVLTGTLGVSGLSTFTSKGAAAASAPRRAAPTTCDASGFSIDQDRNGLNVRDAPSTKGKILGKLYSVSDPEVDDGELFGPRFSIREVRAGWVLISGADPVSEEINGGELKQNYTGVGWVSAKKVRGIAYAKDMSSPLTSSFTEPSATAKVSDPDGLTNVNNMKEAFGSYPTVASCSGEWLQLTYRQSGYLNTNKKWVKYTTAQRQKRAPVTAWLHSIALKDY